MPRLRRVAIVLVLFLVLCFIVLNLLAFNHARSMLNFHSVSGEKTSKPEHLTAAEKLKVLLRGIELPRPQSKLPPTSLDEDCVKTRIEDPGRPDLGAWYCDPDDSDALVLLFHGYAGDKTDVLEEAKVFLESGYAVLLVDFRGSGESTGSSTTLGHDEAEDVARAVSFAEEFLNHSRVILYGKSMGAAAILRAVHVYNLDPEAIVIEAVFDRLINTVRNRFKLMGVPAFPNAELLVFWGGVQAGFNGFEHDPELYASFVRCPVLMLQGEEDPRAKVHEAMNVFEAVSTKKRFVVFESLTHESYLSASPDRWRTEVMQFLGEATPMSPQ